MQLHSTALRSIVRTVLPRPVRNAIRKPGASWERLMSKWKRLRGAVAEVEVIAGWKVKCHPMCEGEFSVFQKDPRQAPEMLNFSRLASPGMQFLDVGTHWGVFTLAALHFGGQGARVIGIEASDAAARVYRDNLSINKVTDRVTVINAACGDHVGELKMLTTGAGGADFFVVPAEERPDTVTVPLVTVDSVVEQHGFKPTHLKIDVEGFEEEVLKGATRTLADIRPVLFLELHGDQIHERGLSPETVLLQLEQLGYTVWQSLEGQTLTRADFAPHGYNVRFVVMRG
ncbi:MAG: FkbM family methyltransferase [Verrucomicrobiaceae bacterium]|nr:FkbM family methyltransferase [Verrucomicrobiaceae bacterium]